MNDQKRKLIAERKKNNVSKEIFRCSNNQVKRYTAT